MGATPTYALPYPELDDPDNVPTDMHELADAVESKLAAEAGARANADAAIDGRVTAETNARVAADTAEANARVAGDNALGARATALEARPRSTGGRTLVSFVDGHGQLAFPSNLGNVIAVTVSGADPSAFNAIYSVDAWSGAGASLWCWGINNTPLTRDLLVAWIAVYQ
jgi:hypothetical protein